VAGVGDGGCTTGIAVARSTDAGRTFGRPTLAQLDRSCLVNSGKPWIAVDGNRRSPYYGRLYLGWTQFHRNAEGRGVGQQQVMRHSTDRGRTWSPPLALTRPDEFTQGTTVVIQPDGAVTDVYYAFPPDGSYTDVMAQTFRDGAAPSRRPSR
jgi:hypothetical protein